MVEIRLILNAEDHSVNVQIDRHYGTPISVTVSEVELAKKIEKHIKDYLKKEDNGNTNNRNSSS